ncbi:hypothetical protein RDI58_022462 [Solanum bulbocastanum]|uniref:Uncharacterized protein n=1 Tax=Solanum bulbocastanum TaxID=147425 RepID=A0AAN8T9B9_SOLBU
MDPNGRVFTQKVQYDWVPEYCGTCLQLGHLCKQLKPATGEAKEPRKPAHMGNKGKVVKKIWHKKSPDDDHREAISMLAGTLVTTQEEQWQNVKGKSKTIPHPTQNIYSGYQERFKPAGHWNHTNGTYQEYEKGHESRYGVWYFQSTRSKKNLFSWNVTSMNKAGKHKEFNAFLGKYSICLISIYEYRVQENKVQRIITKFGRIWSWFHNYRCSDRNRICILWDPNHIVFTVDAMMQHIHGRENTMAGSQGDTYEPARGMASWEIIMLYLILKTEEEAIQLEKWKLWTLMKSSLTLV